VETDPNRRQGDVHGVLISFSYRAHLVGDDPAVVLEVRLRGAKGRPVRAAVASPALRDRSGHLRVTVSLEVSAGEGQSLAQAFVPFYAMDLDPGPHRLDLGLKALGLTQAGLEQRPVEVRGGKAVAVTITKPPFRMAQLGVRRVEVEPDAYDAALARPRKARPDLAWRLSYKGMLPGVVFTSRTQSDRYEATWQQQAPPFPFCEGDVLTLQILDADFVDHDVIASFPFTLEQLGQAGVADEPLRRGKVRILELTPVTLR
jgi:hypothetical protein